MPTCAIVETGQQRSKGIAEQDPRRSLDKLRVCMPINKQNKAPGGDRVTHRARRTGQGLSELSKGKPKLLLGFPPGKCCITHTLQKRLSIVKPRAKFLAPSSHFLLSRTTQNRKLGKPLSSSKSPPRRPGPLAQSIRARPPPYATVSLF